MAIIKEKQDIETQKTITSLKQKLAYVSPSDYLETNKFIEDAYNSSAI